MKKNIKTSNEILLRYLDDFQTYIEYILNQLSINNIIEKENGKYIVSHSLLYQLSGRHGNIKNDEIVPAILNKFIGDSDRWILEDELFIISRLIELLLIPRDYDEIHNAFKDKGSKFIFHIIKNKSEMIRYSMISPKENEIVYLQEWDKFKPERFKKGLYFVDFIDHPYLDLEKLFENVGKEYSIRLKDKLIGKAMLIGLDNRHITENTIKTIRKDTHSTWKKSDYLKYAKENWGTDDFEGTLQIFYITDSIYGGGE